MISVITRCPVRSGALLVTRLATLVGALVSAMPCAAAGAAIPGSATAPGVTRYVSQSQGNDAWDGLAPRRTASHGPWKTLARASETTFADGDQLLLKCGDVWNDGLDLKGHGSAANPAVIASYGAGPRPRIDRQDPSMAGGKRCVTLDGNAHGWRLAGLELANGINGVMARIAEAGHSYLRLERLYIHGCKHGGPFPHSDGDQNNQQIGILLTGPITGAATITGCTLEDNFVGITTSTPSEITDCVFKHMEWTALWYVANGGVIRGNKFMHNCDQPVWCGVSDVGTSGSDWVFEYNEFGETQRHGASPDGEGLDFEAGCRNVTVRNNLFHDTAGPAMMVYNGAGGSSPDTGISVHDNVIHNAALAPSADTYRECLLLIGAGHSGRIANNRLYTRPGVPAFGTAGGTSPDLIRTANLEQAIEDEPSGPNVAVAARATASSNTRQAASVIDGRTSTAWRGASASNQWVQLDFGRAITLDKFVVEQAPGSAINDFVLQYWNGRVWKDLFTSWSPMGSTRYLPTWGVTTARVRLFITSTAGGAPAISEFRAFNTKPSPLVR